MKLLFLRWLSLTLALMMATPAAAGPVFSARVLKVIDGDSLEVDYAGHKIKLRLWGIDAPEMRQSYGKQAKIWLAAMVKGRTIEAEAKDIDIYNRLVTLVWVDGQSVNEEMVRQGAAWVYRSYCREGICDTWQSLQNDARSARRGLWANEKTFPPWQARRRHDPRK